MPKFLEAKLRAEYGDDPHAIYGTMNKLGAMHGNKETEKGREMEAKHRRDTEMGKFKGKVSDYKQHRPKRKVVNRYK